MSDPKDCWFHREAMDAERLSKLHGMPAYIIRKIHKHRWQVLALKEGGPGDEPYYNYLVPAAANCTTRREALEWMRHKAQRREPDFSKMQRADIESLHLEYDHKGRPWRKNAGLVPAYQVMDGAMWMP